MIRQRQRDAVRQLGFRQRLAGIEQDGAVAAVAQFRIKLAKGLDQVGLAMEVDRDLMVRGLHAVDADGAAAAAFAGEITDLSSFQRLLEGADAWRGARNVEDQLA